MKQWLKNMKFTHSTSRSETTSEWSHSSLRRTRERQYRSIVERLQNSRADSDPEWRPRSSSHTTRRPTTPRFLEQSETESTPYASINEWSNRRRNGGPYLSLNILRKFHSFLSILQTDYQATVLRRSREILENESTRRHSMQLLTCCNILTICNTMLTMCESWLDVSLNRIIRERPENQLSDQRSFSARSMESTQRTCEEPTNPWGRSFSRQRNNRRPTNDSTSARRASRSRRRTTES